MFQKYAEQILKIFNYVDSALITDSSGIILYYYTNRQDMNRLEADKITGRHILDVFSNINTDTSTVMQVLRTGKPVLNLRQELVTTDDIHLNAVTSTLPITEGHSIIGTIDVSSYDNEKFALSYKDIKNDQDLYTVDEIVTLSDKMLELKEKIKKVSDTDSTVMIYGETGTGKELVVQSIHTAGKRKNRPFIAQNCSAIPSTLLESILFGTVKGSFTGAENRKGLFEMADTGTLFLDEINSMELSVQGKILKAIEEKQITRVGGSTPVKVDVKIISATNQSLEECLKQNSIRADLLYRLSVVRLTVPPLRERKIDIAPLIKSFINMFNYKMNKNIINVEDSVYELFNGYDWPGNIRELKSAIESGFNIASGRFITIGDLPEYLVNSMKTSASEIRPDYRYSLREMVENYEKQVIQQTIRDSGSKVEAAEKLKITKQVLNYKLRKYGLE